MYLILALIVFGMFAGWLAQLILGRNSYRTNWSLALASGLLGSFVGGLLFSLISGKGLELRASGLIGSVIGAVIVTFGYQKWQAAQAG